MLRHTTLCAIVVVIMAMGSTYAQTPDGACDGLGLEDNAWGLCNAYCTAMDCDGDRNASGQACVQVALSFYRATDGDPMPCETLADPPGPQTASCPCNFDQSWSKEPQILRSSDIPICNGTEEDDPICKEDPSTYITCQIIDMSGSTTFLSVLANLWTGGTSSEEDKLLFFTSEPSSQLEGECGVDVLFDSGEPFLGELPVTNEEFSACATDIGALQNDYAAMCPNTKRF